MSFTLPAKRARHRPKPAQPIEAVAPADSRSERLNRLAHGCLLSYLVLVPNAFCTFTHEAFEFPKMLLLGSVAILLVILQLSAVVWRGTPPILKSGRWRFDLIALGVVALLFSAGLSTLFSVSPRTSLLGAHHSYAGLGVAIGFGVVFFSVRNLIRTAQDRQELLGAALLGAVPVALYALVQFCQRDPLIWSGVSDFAKQDRPFGTLGHANHLAAYLVMVLPIAAGLCIRAGQMRRWGILVGLLLTSGLLVSVAVLSLSRSAWAAMLFLGAAGAALLVLRKPNRRRVLVFLAGIVTLGGGALALFTMEPVLRERAAGMLTLGSRPHLWNAGLRMFADHPIAGSGLDTFALSYGQYRPAEVERIEWDITPAKAHNEFIHILATQGLIGAFALLLLLTGLLRAVVIVRRSATAGDHLVIVAGIAACGILILTGFLVIACGSLLAVLLALLPRDAASEPVPPVRARAGSVAWRIGIGATVLVLALNFLFAPHVRPGVTRWLVLAAVGALFIGAGFLFIRLLRQSERTSDAPARTTVGTAHPWQIAAQAALVLIGAALLAQVAESFEASMLCAEGDRLAAVDPERATHCFEKAGELSPNRATLWTIRGSAALRMANAPDNAGGREHHLQQARQALQRAVELVPADGQAHANLARAFVETASELPENLEKAQAEFDAALHCEPADPRLLVEAGWWELRRGHPDRARQRARQARAISPTYGNAFALLAETSWQQGRVKEGFEFAWEALRSDWHDESDARRNFHGRVGVLLFEVGKLDRALTMSQWLIASWPDWTTGHLLLAATRERLGQRDLARAGYERVLELDPKNAHALAGRYRLAARP